MIRFIKPKDKSNFLYFCKKFHPDFYVIRAGKKLYLTDLKLATKIFKSCIKHNNKCIVCETNGEITGVALILNDYVGSQNYLKILTINIKVMQGIIQYIIWHIRKEFIASFNKRNYLFRLCKERRYEYSERKKFGFRFLKDNNREISFKYIPNLVKQREFNFKGDD